MDPENHMFLGAEERYAENYRRRSPIILPEMLRAVPRLDGIVLPLMFHSRVFDHYKHFIPQQKKLVPNTSYIRVEAAVRAQDAARPKPTPRYARPQETASSRCGNLHYALHLGAFVSQAFIY